MASAAIHFNLLHSHRLRPQPDQIQNPNSKRAVWSLDFGVWSLDFGFWISLAFVIFAAAPNGAFWILEFGLGLGSIDTAWILHKIFPCHADSGRRILKAITKWWPPKRWRSDWSRVRNLRASLEALLQKSRM